MYKAERWKEVKNTCKCLGDKGSEVQILSSRPINASTYSFHCRCFFVFMTLLWLILRKTCLNENNSTLRFRSGQFIFLLLILSFWGSTPKKGDESIPNHFIWSNFLFILPATNNFQSFWSRMLFVEWVSFYDETTVTSRLLFFTWSQ